MYRSLFAWILFSLMMGSAWADDREMIEKAQTAYRAGDYASAFEALSHLPNLLGVVPLFDRPQQSQRAEIFFDLGRMHMASGDTARARLALVEAFYLHPEVNRGDYGHSPRPGTCRHADIAFGHASQDAATNP